MRARVTKVDEFQFLTCLKHGLWGSKSARFKDWEPGDLLFVLVGKGLAAFAEVNGKPYVSQERVWDNGVYPHRIPIAFRHAMRPENRPPVLGEIREALIAAFGTRYGWGILNQRLMGETAADQLLNQVKKLPNNLKEITGSLDQHLAEARSQRGVKHTKATVKVSPHDGKAKAGPPSEPSPNGTEDSEHGGAQHALIRLGRAAGCSVWIASNDRSRKYHGAALGDGCLTALPEMGLNPEAKRRIGLIDVIWVQKNTPVCAFEVETSTSIYSGLLRMSDLLALMPLLKLELFIVAPRERQAKTMDELDRPTFRKIGLSEYCRFIATEDLKALLGKVGDLEGHVHPSVVNKIAVELEDETQSVS